MHAECPEVPRTPRIAARLVHSRSGVAIVVRGCGSFDPKGHIVRRTLACLLALFLAVIARADGPEYLNFETDTSGKPPAAWFVPGPAAGAGWTGIVEHFKLAAIIGEATAGTNGNVTAFTLPGGYSVGFTGMRVLKHDGSTHHGIGIKPTIPIERTIEGIAAGKDEFLEAAILYVEKNKHVR